MFLPCNHFIPSYTQCSPPPNNTLLPTTVNYPTLHFTKLYYPTLYTSLHNNNLHHNTTQKFKLLFTAPYKLTKHYTSSLETSSLYLTTLHFTTLGHTIPHYSTPNCILMITIRRCKARYSPEPFLCTCTLHCTLSIMAAHQRNQAMFISCHFDF